MIRTLALLAATVALTCSANAGPFATPGQTVLSQANGIALSDKAAAAFLEFKTKNHYGAFAVNTKQGAYGYVHGVHSAADAQELAKLTCKRWSPGYGRHCKIFASLMPASGAAPAGTVTLSKTSSKTYATFKTLAMKPGTFAAFAINGTYFDGYVWNRASEAQAQKDAVETCKKLAKKHYKQGIPVSLHDAQTHKRWGCRVVAVVRK